MATNTTDRLQTDARQSSALARPSALLAACDQRISSAFYRKLTPSADCHRNSTQWIETTKLGCHGNVLSGIEKLISD